MEDDRGASEMNGHSSRSKRRRLKLYSIQVDQFDARTSGHCVADFDDGDCGLCAGVALLHDSS